MISLTPADLRVDPAVLGVPGGFLWWYFDLVDDAGRGMVLIWSYGLPFLPNLASPARKGQPIPPGRRPSLNLVCYNDGRPELYLLQEYPPEDTAWEGLDWRMGDNTMHAEVSEDGQLSVTICLSCPIPRSPHRLTGTLTVRGALRQGGSDGAPSPDHEWSPLTVAAHGEADLHIGPQHLHLAGRAYHDRNLGRRPLHDLGIERWWWGRLAFPEREVIFYYLLPRQPDAPPRSVVLEIDAQGQTTWAEDAAITLEGRRRSPYGLWHPRRMTFADPRQQAISVTLEALVDDGPFYQRYLLVGRQGAVSARGVGELVVPDRVDQDWLRPLVRMRVHHPGTPQADSFWLPLFSGPRQGRLGRLLSAP